MWDNVIIALKVMGQGMLGIFTAILLIMITIYILRRILRTKKQTPDNGD